MMYFALIFNNIIKKKLGAKSLIMYVVISDILSKISDILFESHRNLYNNRYVSVFKSTNYF